ncbi:DUF1707 domain-containing protein [Streptomyces sp. NPDC051315]|uniref:DUF1707 domain-containing protein n=1 Tax=Streptomyces sp. NPDC051315 TaxID=3365650 RepID=UPI00379A78AF
MPGENPPFGQAGLRASHGDQDWTVEVLRVAAGDGRLISDELDGRLEAALSAARLQRVQVPSPQGESRQAARAEGGAVGAECLRAHRGQVLASAVRAAAVTSSRSVYEVSRDAQPPLRGGLLHPRVQRAGRICSHPRHLAEEELS